jgi:hypothetical protein
MILPLDSSLGPIRGEKPEKDLTYPALRRKLEELRDNPVARAPFLVEWHKRAALPVAALVFAMLGFPLAVRSHRGGRSIALVGSLVILVCYYLMLTTLEGSACVAPARCRGHLGAQRVFGPPAWRARHHGAWPSADQPDPCGGPGRRSRHAPAPPALAAAPGAARIHHIIDRYLIREFLVTGTGWPWWRAVRGHRSHSGAGPVPAHQALDRAHPGTSSTGRRRNPQGLPIVMLVATIFLFLGFRYHERPP